MGSSSSSFSSFLPFPSSLLPPPSSPNLTLPKSYPPQTLPSPNLTLPKSFPPQILPSPNLSLPKPYPPQILPSPNLTLPKSYPPLPQHDELLNNFYDQNTQFKNITNTRLKHHSVEGFVYANYDL